MSNILSYHTSGFFGIVNDYLYEKEKLKRVSEIEEDVGEGICESCGGRDVLTRLNDMMVCESCKNSM